jgi:hypothetical protein
MMLERNQFSRNDAKEENKKHSKPFETGFRPGRSAIRMNYRNRPNELRLRTRYDSEAPRSAESESQRDRSAGVSPAWFSAPRVVTGCLCGRLCCLTRGRDARAPMASKLSRPRIIWTETQERTSALRVAGETSPSQFLHPLSGTTTTHTETICIIYSSQS